MKFHFDRCNESRDRAKEVMCFPRKVAVIADQ